METTKASRDGSLLLKAYARREHLVQGALVVLQKMKEKYPKMFWNDVDADVEANGAFEDEENEDERFRALEDCAKIVALVDQASKVMSSNNNNDNNNSIHELYFKSSSTTSRVSQFVKKRTRTLCEDLKQALRNVLRRALKRTNWPPPLTPSHLSEYEWNIMSDDTNGVVVSRCCELLFVLQNAMEMDGFVDSNSTYDFVAETFAIDCQKRFEKAFASSQHSRAPELMLNCCVKQIEQVPALVSSALINYRIRNSTARDDKSFLEEMFENRSSAFAKTFASALGDSARILFKDIYCTKCETDERQRKKSPSSSSSLASNNNNSKKWWLHLADCAIEFDDKCAKEYGRFPNRNKCLDILANSNEDWKISWLSSELEAGWNEVKPLVESKDVGWECECEAETREEDEDGDGIYYDDDNAFNDIEPEAPSLSGIGPPKVAIHVASLLMKLVARSEKLTDDEHRVEFLARVPALLVEKFRDAIDYKAAEIEHDLFSSDLVYSNAAVTQIGSCIAACLKIEETLSEISEWPFLVELVRGYNKESGEEENKRDEIEDAEDAEGVFDDECKMCKETRDAWIDRLANVAIGKSCDALDGYRSYASALRFTKLDDDEELNTPATNACHNLLVGLPMLRSWLELLHRSLDARAFQRAWRKICKGVSKRAFSTDVISFIEKKKLAMSEYGLNQFSIDVDTFIATFVQYSSSGGRRAVAHAIDSKTREFLQNKL